MWATTLLEQSDKVKARFAPSRFIEAGQLGREMDRESGFVYTSHTELARLRRELAETKQLLAEKVLALHRLHGRSKEIQ